MCVRRHTRWPTSSTCCSSKNAKQRARSSRTSNGKKTAYRRVRIALGAVALVGASAALYGFSKRETLRLAGELEQAKAEGAASFEELDTCAAAHQLAIDDAKSCRGERAAEEERFMRSISGLVTDNQQTVAETERRLDETGARLRTCEADERAATEDRDDLAATLDAKEGAWTKERGDLLGHAIGSRRRPATLRGRTQDDDEVADPPARRSRSVHRRPRHVHVGAPRRAGAFCCAREAK